ncbi:hypothetical protein Sjap_023960 [Stephania japonica]|uniref:tRNA/rRNA methyltransferase SpoU type domain-containing protein n=1 Tax=Stephania japonica TaxID=461633 RepID=A0AAP0EHV6_9MAGN
MHVCRSLVRTYLSTLERKTQSTRVRPHRNFSSSVTERTTSISATSTALSCSSPPSLFLGFTPYRASSRSYHRVLAAAAAVSRHTEQEDEDSILYDVDAAATANLMKDTVEDLLLNKDDVAGLMKMERKSGNGDGKRWFPYVDRLRAGNLVLNSGEVIEALDPYILDVRKDRIRNVVKNRSYSVCLVVEGLSDFGNVSAAFRSADALGIQSVHVVSCDSSKRYRENRHVSMGAEKWLDIELWDSIQECFVALKSRGYCIATTHVGMEAVCVYDMDWSQPTAIVVGNESRGISSEALKLADLHCSIPMKGMVDSFNVSVAAGILMHHAVSNRNSRLVNYHRDINCFPSRIIMDKDPLRKRRSSIIISCKYFIIRSFSSRVVRLADGV